MEAKIIGKRIEELMDMEGISFKKLANSLNISVQEAEKKINGEEEFYISEMMKIKELFHLNLERFTKRFFEKDFDCKKIIQKLYK